MQKVIFNLEDTLLHFVPAKSMNAITEQFRELACHCLYGGYLRVGNSCRVYFRSVEFYYWDEKDAENPLNDEKMYHCDGKYPTPVGMEMMPYYPAMSLHAHTSGFDICFEKECEYRAGALIRGFVVQFGNSHTNYKIVTKNGKQEYKECADGEYDPCSTHLYTVINGLRIGKGVTIDIEWVDTEMPDPLPSPRAERRKNIPDNKPWQFIY